MSLGPSGLGSQCPITTTKSPPCIGASVFKSVDNENSEHTDSRDAHGQTSVVRKCDRDTKWHMAMGCTRGPYPHSGGWDDGAAPVVMVGMVGRLPRVLDAPRKTFRFWIDYQVLSSPASAALLEKALLAAGGVKSGGPPKLDPVTAATQKIKDYGYMHMDAWEFLWSITAKAMLAAEILRPGQLVSIIPGFLSITRKTSLIRSLKAVYNEDAFHIVPRTFKLPDELDEWADWIQRHPKQDTGMWMLKNNKQRGTGLRLVTTQEAFGACFETTTRPGMEGMTLYRWYLAQQYITKPLLINGCKFGIRVWVLVPGLLPLRTYMHINGLVLFSSHRYDLDAISATPDGGVAPGHVTNYAQNENGEVWSLQQLWRHVGQDAAQRLWSAIQKNTAMVFAAALPRAKEVQTQMALPPRSSFQFFGLDFLVDEGMRPWLLEVNATPSMKVEHCDPVTEQLIYDQKWPVIKDMVKMMGICPERFDPEAKEHQDIRFMEAEMHNRGGFVPLMHLFPNETPEGLKLLPWHSLDRQLKAWMASSGYSTASRAYA